MWNHDTADTEPLSTCSPSPVGTDICRTHKGVTRLESGSPGREKRTPPSVSMPSSLTSFSWICASVPGGRFPRATLKISPHSSSARAAESLLAIALSYCARAYSFYAYVCRPSMSAVRPTTACDFFTGTERALPLDQRNHCSKLAWNGAPRQSP